MERPEHSCCIAGLSGEVVGVLIGERKIDAFRGIPAQALQKIPLQSGAVELATGQIELFFHDVVPGLTKREHLSSLISCLSGRLFREFRLLEQTLERAEFNLSLEDVEAISKIFKDCQGLLASRLAALKRFIKPARPECTPAAGSWGTTDWLKWSVEDICPSGNGSRLQGRRTSTSRGWCSGFQIGM